ncbi:MAG: type II toxin-antitoxin system RelE/ParE family toxin [Candidatus Bathyarchaeia archaeon]|jgi:mRNA-degrading endonuclease RelE of RelBE toxin-antitoxin system
MPRVNPLRHPLEGLRRVHVGSFVLIFEAIEEIKTVRLITYKYHDEAYV